MSQYDNTCFRFFHDTASGCTDFAVIESGETKVENEHMTWIKKLCRQEGINYTVLSGNQGMQPGHVRMDSRFSDLVVIDSDWFCKYPEADVSYHFLENAIQKAESPVLMIPEDTPTPDQTILAYDGTASSVYAIKQFAYLFPAFRKNKTFLVYAGDDKASEIPYENDIKELAGKYFSDLTILHFPQNSKRYFAKWLSAGRNAILVIGAYGRSALSQLFHKSFAASLIAKPALPVFIAHR